MMCFGLKDRKRLKTNHCVIVLLDDTQLVHELHPATTGQDLLDVVFKHLNLLETSYFGLKYYTRQQQNEQQQQELQQEKQQQQAQIPPPPHIADASWLDMDKSAIRQLRDSHPMTIYFGVKYYASDPCKLAEEITRYQFFLQCKQDILQARLPVSFELAIELFGLAIQSELGDFDRERHLEGYVNEFQFVPHQTYELEQRAAHFHRQLTGQVPATAELNFLERLKWLDLYGCELHPIQYDDGERGDQYALGLNPTGVLVLRNKLKVAQYLWSRIAKTKCQGRCFLMDVIEPSGGGGEQSAAMTRPDQTSKNRFGFRLADKEASRRLRWSIEEHRSFYFLINSSTATLNQRRHHQHQQQQQQQRQQQQQQDLIIQHHHQQQQQLKFGQRFRQSIRSAMSVGAHSAAYYQHQYLAAAEHQKHLRSSMKSIQQQQQQQQRQPPTVVRMPSRRYGHSSRSLQRPAYNVQVAAAAVAANGNGLPLVAGGHSSSASGSLPAPPPPPFLPPPPTTQQQQQRQQQQHHSSGAHTMVESQRQQALLMMQQQYQQFAANQQAACGGNSAPLKSQTLRPSSSSKEAKRNLHYQQQMLMAAALAQQRQQQLGSKNFHHQLNNHNNQPAAPLPEISILPPGQHIVQPSIYKATSVIDGVNQLGLAGQSAKLEQLNSDLLIRQQPSTAAMMMQQIHHNQQQQHHQTPSQRAYRPSRGHESPRSTKSAIAPSSAIKLASKKLAKQQQYQQQLYYEATAAGQLLLPPPPHDYSSTTNNNNNTFGDFCTGAQSASASPRTSRRLARLHRSKSTGENLNLISAQTQFNNNNKMLLTTAAPYLSGPTSLPPPDYNTSSAPQQARKPTAGNLNQSYRDDGAMLLPNKKFATLSSDHSARHSQARQKQRSSILALQNFVPIQGSVAVQRSSRKAKAGASDEDDDDYYCSRSDCSSMDGRGGQANSLLSHGQQRQARFINGQLMFGSTADNNNKQLPQHRQQPATLTAARRHAQGKEPHHPDQFPLEMVAQKDWNAIKRRHNEFSSGKGLLGQLGGGETASARSNQISAPVRQQNNAEPNSNNNNNNNNISGATTSGPSNLVKNITNKQATPILLSMSHQFVHQMSGNGGGNNNPSDQQANSKAVQLLNLQRQQLNSSSSTSTEATPSKQQQQQHIHSTAAAPTNGGNASSSSPRSSIASSSSSPKAVSQQNKPHHHHHHAAEGSTASNNSTTSGYYAGSNSTGPASVDSDTIDSISTTVINRPKVSMGQFRANGARMVVGAGSDQTNPEQNLPDKKPQQFYLGQDTKANHEENNNDLIDGDLEQANNKHQPKAVHNQRQWSPLDQLQQHAPSSLKYVSFDV